MNAGSLLLILGSVALTAVAQLCIKIASGRFAGATTRETLLPSLMAQFLDPLSLIAVAAYVISLFLWFLALRDVPLSVAFPFTGLTMALVSLLGIVALGETLSGTKIAGVALAIVAVLLLSRS